MVVVAILAIISECLSLSASMSLFLCLLSTAPLCPVGFSNVLCEFLPRQGNAGLNDLTGLKDQLNSGGI